MLVPLLQDTSDVKFCRTLCELAFKINNCVQLHDYDCHLLRHYCEFFYKVVFSGPIFQLYREDDAHAERIISYGLSFFGCLLEAPGIWDHALVADQG